jgi:uncharacterized protein
MGDDSMSVDEPIESNRKPAVPDIASTAEERSNAMLAHLLGAVIGFIGPLIFYVSKKDSPFVQDASREALNFHLTLMIGVLVTFGCGVVIFHPIGIVFSIIGGMAANKGEVYRYPWKFEFIK